MNTIVISTGVRYSRSPESYARPESERPRLSEISDCENVPVIDLGCEDRPSLKRQIGDACEEYGFFQVTNHGVGLEAVGRMKEVEKEFFEMPVKEKQMLYSDDPAKTMRLSTSFNVDKEKVHNWSLQKYVPGWPSNPPQFNPSSSSQNLINLLSSVEDLHGGVTVEMIEPMDSKLFASKLGSSLSYWIQQKKRVVWIKLHSRCFDLVCPAVEEGFWYDHAKPDYLMLVKWIPETSDTLPANASHRYMEVDRTAIFSKSLAETDIKARLAVPTGALNHIKMPEGGNYVYTKDSDGKEWKFRCYTRPTGHSKPAFIGDWRKFVKAKGLQIDDNVTLSALEDEDESGGEPQYIIHAKRWSRVFRLMGAEVYAWVDLPHP